MKVRTVINNLVAFKNNPQDTPNKQTTTAPIKENNKDEFISAQNKKNKLKKGIILGIATGGLAIGAIALGKFNKIKKLKAIPEDLRVIFSEIKDKDGKEFINEAYGKLTKYMGLEEIAPKDIGYLGKDQGTIVVGGYMQSFNEIKFSDGFFTKLPKEKQINMLAHELDHCRQTANILRTEGLGITEYTKAMTELLLKKSIDPKFANPDYIKDMLKAMEKGQELEFFTEAEKKFATKIYARTKTNYAEILKLPKIPADSAEGKRAAEYLEGLRNYKGIFDGQECGEEYLANPMEIDARSVGDKIEKLFRMFCGQ